MTRFFKSMKTVIFPPQYDSSECTRQPSQKGFAVTNQSLGPGADGKLPTL